MMEKAFGRFAAAKCMTALLPLALVIAACGSSSSSSDHSSSTQALAAATQVQSPALHAVVSAAEQTPQFRITAALPHKPPPGKTVVYLQDDVAQSQTIGSGVKDAAQAVGWNYSVINYKSADTSTLLTALDDALTKHPVAVIFDGAPEAIWASKKAEYAKAGVLMVPGYVGPATIDNTVIGNTAGIPDNDYAGKVLADWFILNSGGSGKAVIQSVAGFPVIDLWVKAFKDEVANSCKKCQVVEDRTTTDALAQGTSTGALLSRLQQNPSIKYAFAYNTNFVIGITAALANAGLTGIHVGGWSATSEGVADIVRGQDYAWMVLNTRYSGWLSMHIVLNHITGGKPIPADQQILPQQLITKNNATTELAKTANAYSQPVGYEQKFKALWHVQ